MRYAKIRKLDVSNGPGLRASLYIQGCSHHCKGCFNQDTWDFDGGKEWTQQTKENFLHVGEREYIKGYSILGGEPLDQGEEMLELVKYIKENSNKSIWMWTGYVYENLSPLQKEIVSYVDYLVDGPFIEEEKDFNLRFAGSKNQRILPMQKVTKYGIISIKEEAIK